MAAVAGSKGRIAGNLVARVLGGKAASPRYENERREVGLKMGPKVIVLGRRPWPYVPGSSGPFPVPCQSFPIWTVQPGPGPYTLQRAVHASAYDKNLDEQVRPAFVPDDVIGGPNNPDKYWGPHPTTGVFGPAVLDGKLVAGAPPTAAANGTVASVLDQKVRYRPLEVEDIEKPPPTA